MKKILCLALVLILTMSVAMSASAFSTDDIANTVSNAIGNFDPSSISLPKFESLNDAFKALSDFVKFEGIMVYVNEFHAYMGDFYVELNTALKGFGLVINSILDSFLLLN